MKVDPSKPPFSYDQHWPYVANFGHPIPPHFCCGHNNFPCYYSHIPSYPHAPSPIYEYDKHMPREHHCCGCSNHPCNQKEGRSVKIEEHEPDDGKKVNDALVPVQLKNYPYQLVWVPQDYSSNKQLKNPNVMEVAEQDKVSHDRKPSGLENFKADAQPSEEPRVWNGWLPFDIKGAPDMFHDGYGTRNQKPESENNRREFEDGKMDQKHQSEHKRSEFPFPIFWVPYYNKQEESGKANNQENTSSPKIIEEVPHTFKSVPVKSHVDEGALKGTGSNQVGHKNTDASDAVEKVTNARSIPVKQIESHQGKNESEGDHQREVNVTKKDSGTGDKKRQSTSSPKASKLAPVCLRVDPLPRKKNGNGSSRSPSPPSSKEHSRATNGEAFKTPVQTNVNIPNEGPKGKRETCTDGDEYKTEDQGAEKMKGETIELKEENDSSIPTDAGRKEGRVLSDADAAVLIQAAYRGYQVRKWEPLKKLKQIDEVRREVADVYGRVQAFERSSDLQNDEKQKIAIGETIMRLLLKLDTLQGLHPSFREIRKSLARELTSLQERLDSITAKKPQQEMQDFDVQKHVEVTPNDTQNEEHVQREQEEKVATPGDSSEDITDDVKGPCASDGKSESQSPVDPASNERAEHIVLPNGSYREDTSQVVTADALNPTSDVSDTNKMAAEPEAKSEANDIPTEADELDTTDSEEFPVEVVGEDCKDVTVVDDSAHDPLDSENHAIMELPVGLLDKDEGDNEMNISKEKAQTENEIIFEELPVRLLDEDTTISGVKKHDQTKPKTYKEVLLAQEGEFNVDEKPSSSTDDTAKQTQLEQQQHLEEQEEVQSSGESDGWVKIEFQNEGELKGDDDSPMDMVVECKSGEEVGNDTKLPPLTAQDKGDEPGNEDASMEANDVNSISPEAMKFVPISDMQKEEEPEEKIAQRETQEMVVEQAINDDDKDTQTLAQEKTELSDGGLSGDSKLLEENEKLRKMMKKLLEAGNEQLNVISDLTGRVKDLEKKLARSRSKRVKTKRYRPATSKMSCMKSSK
uniref:BAG domain-containing protein n=1 Tax=Cajanus cajan TaxID=3821 RepID=A0A151UD43_CAJCA|nr:hypothetical protein KK1_021464 [Cajanus cajan]